MQAKMRIQIEYLDLAAALTLCFHFINGAIGIDGISAVNIAVIWGLLILIFCKKKEVNCQLGLFLTVAYFLLGFAISFIRLENISNTLRYLAYFFAFDLVAFYIGGQKVSIERVQKYMVAIGVVGLAVYLLRGFDGVDSGITMGISYAILPVFLSSVVVLFCYKDFRIWSLTCTVLSLYIYIRVSPRGVWLSILFFAFFLFMYLLTRNKPKQKQLLIRALLMVLVLCVVILFVNNLYEVVVWLNNFLKNTLHISISALNKIIFYYKKNDLINGRGELWETGIAYIQASPIIGSGIGYFENFHDGAHPHNILIQAMCERGIIYTGFLLLVALKAVKTLLMPNTSITLERYGYLAVITTAGVFMLFYSSSVWLWVPFWYFLGYVLFQIKEDKEKEKI